MGTDGDLWSEETLRKVFPYKSFRPYQKDLVSFSYDMFRMSCNKGIPRRNGIRVNELNQI